MIRKRSVAALIACCLSLGLLPIAEAGANTYGKNNTHIVQDLSGMDVAAPQKAERIVSLIPAVTQIVIALGGGDRLAAISGYGNMKGLEVIYPPIARIPSITKMSGIDSRVNFEELMTLRPDVVFCMGRGQSAQIEALGIPALDMLVNNYDQLKKAVLIIGEMIGPGSLKKSVEYNAILDRNLARVRTVTDRMPLSDRPKVYYVWGADVLSTSGANTLVDDWIRYSGGVNIVGRVNGGGSGSAHLSIEQIVKENPDIIIIGGVNNAASMRTIQSNPVWSGIKAVKNHRVYSNPSGVFPWDRLGTDSTLQVLWAAKLFHPDKFKDISIENETKAYYKKLYNYALTDGEVQLMLQGNQHWPDLSPAVKHSK